MVNKTDVILALIELRNYRGVIFLKLYIKELKVLEGIKEVQYGFSMARKREKRGWRQTNGQILQGFIGGKV